MPLDRRHFLRALGSVAGAWALSPRTAVAGAGAPAHAPVHASMPTRAITLRIALLLPPGVEDGDVARGAALGVAEAAHAARMLGGAVTLATGHDAARLLDEARPHVLLAGAGAAACDALVALTARGAALVLNVGCDDDALRAACHALLFHVAPGAAMARHALAQAQAGAGSGSGRAVPWHATLERYGAAQLNDRWRAAHGAGMPPAAWPSWMAVKIAWETASRARTREPAQLAERLLRPATRFDGHKGRPLVFAAHDHQLVQPMYVVTDGTPPRVTDVPPPPAPLDAAAATPCSTGGA